VSILAPTSQPRSSRFLSCNSPLAASCARRASRGRRRRLSNEAFLMRRRSSIPPSARTREVRRDWRDQFPPEFHIWEGRRIPRLRCHEQCRRPIRLRRRGLRGVNRERRHAREHGQVLFFRWRGNRLPGRPRRLPGAKVRWAWRSNRISRARKEGGAAASWGVRADPNQRSRSVASR